MPAKKGHKKAGGRKKGTPNKLTASAKEAFAMAFEGMGGVESLTHWGKLNRTEFYKLFARLIPVDVTSDGERITVTINAPSGEPQP